MNSEKIVKSLQEWKLPPSSPSDVFKRSGIFNFSRDPTVQTVEKEIPLSEGYASFPLFTGNINRVDYNQYSYLHVGMIQVGLKPTKLGSNTSAIICLRDKRLLKFDESVLGMVESSLCDGPIYFSYFPTYCVAWCDRHSTFTIDIKTELGSGGEGEGNPILMYRFHYKVMDRARPDNKNKARSRVDERGDQTTLFLTNVGRSNRVVSKKIYWDQVSVPEKWMNESKPSSSAAEEGEVAGMDWKEAVEAYALKVNVPGFKKDEVNVEVEAAGILLISGERRFNDKENSEWQCIERNSGKFLRRLRLPEDAKTDEVTAEMQNGVLTVTVPKEEVKEKPQVKVVHISG